MAGTRYTVLVRDTAGVAVWSTVHFRKLAYSLASNRPGLLDLTLDAAQAPAGRFVLDGLIEVHRKNEAAGMASYLEQAWLLRTPQYVISDRGLTSYQATAVGLLDLLARRIILAAPGSAGAAKTGAAESVLKAYVEEQAGPTAGGRAIPGLTVTPSGGTGASVSLDRAYENLLDVAAEICQAGGGDMVVSYLGNAAFSLDWYYPRQGTDRTEGNAAGLPPVIFSVDHGNLQVGSYAYDRIDELTAIYVGGEGEGASRTIALALNADRLAESPLNRREAWRDERQGTGAALVTAGEAALTEDSAKRQKLDLTVRQTPSCLYGKHYWLGDLVTVRFAGITMSKKITGVSVTVSGDTSAVEQIAVEFADA